MLSLLNDLSYNLLETFNVDIMMFYISATDHARKLKFSSYVHLSSMNKMFSNRYA